MLYTIDYNEKTEKFQSLFMHGTSSAAVDSILAKGLIQTNFDTVLAEVIANAPWLESIVNDNHNMIKDGALGINARVFEKDIVFATWLANWSGLQAMKSEIGRVVQHGGEVYTVTWNRIAKLAETHRLDAPPFRFLNAQAVVILFQVDFDLNMQVRPYPQAKYRFFETMSQLLSSNSLEPYKGINEVKFLQPLPAERIILHGNFEEVADRLSKDLVSPSAQAALARNRNL